jgi:hypothetical protein
MFSARDAAIFVAAAYDAALEHGRWPDLLRLIADQTASPVARLSVERRFDFRQFHCLFHMRSERPLSLSGRGGSLTAA